MQYMVSVIFDQPGLATPEEDAAIDVFNDRLVAEGHWVFAGGLGAPGTATGEFFICVGDTSSLDGDASKPGDNQGSPPGGSQGGGPTV